MTNEQLGELNRVYTAYVDTFRDAQGKLADMLQLKLDHTHRVVENARKIFTDESWPAPLALLGEAAALLHDTGRYSQFAKFHTFRDAVSVDHAAESVKVVTERRWLESFDREDRQRILTAVGVHNKKDVPTGLDAETAALAHLVRDADKLDIFTVCEMSVRDGSILSNPDITWSLNVHGHPSPDLVEAVCTGHSVKYEWIRSLADFILVEIGWLNGGLHFRTSRAMARERKIADFHEAFLMTLCGATDGDAIHRCCEAARRALN